jgi:hypothetical protein
MILGSFPFLFHLVYRCRELRYAKLAAAKVFNDFFVQEFKSRFIS